MTRDQITLRDLVHNLGDTPDTIAAALRAGGHVGNRNHATSCPVAQYLAGRFPCSRVGYGVIQVFIPGKQVPIEITMPMAISLFVRRFDAGEYPDLVDD
jgi:hypothetical protein